MGLFSSDKDDEIRKRAQAFQEQQEASGMPSQPEEAGLEEEGVADIAKPYKKKALESLREQSPMAADIADIALPDSPLGYFEKAAGLMSKGKRGVGAIAKMRHASPPAGNVANAARQRGLTDNKFMDMVRKNPEGAKEVIKAEGKQARQKFQDFDDLRKGIKDPDKVIPAAEAPLNYRQMELDRIKEIRSKEGPALDYKKIQAQDVIPAQAEKTLDYSKMPMPEGPGKSGYKLDYSKRGSPKLLKDDEE